VDSSKVAIRPGVCLSRVRNSQHPLEGGESFRDLSSLLVDDANREGVFGDIYTHKVPFML
jgi:hypothetical protein